MQRGWRELKQVLLRCRSLRIAAHACFPGARGQVESRTGVVRHRGSDIPRPLGDLSDFEGCFREASCSSSSTYPVSLSDDPQARLK